MGYKMAKRLLEISEVIKLCDECIYCDITWDADTGDLFYVCLHPDTYCRFIGRETINGKDELTIPEWCPLPKLKEGNRV